MPFIFGYFNDILDLLKENPSVCEPIMTIDVKTNIR